MHLIARQLAWLFVGGPEVIEIIEVVRALLTPALRQSLEIEIDLGVADEIEADERE